MSTPTPSREAGLPGSLRALSVVLMVGGGLYALVGLTGVSQDSRAGSLLAMGFLVLGTLSLAIGWSLFKGRRWAYVGAIVLFALIVVTGVLGAIRGDARAIVAQLFLPGLALWLLLRPTARAHFRR